jgi:hypothetical protein
MSPEHQNPLTRRHFLSRTSGGLGIAAFAQLFGSASDAGGVLGAPHFSPRAKRVIYLHMSGGPSQLETFDPKPGLAGWNGKPLPDSVRKGQRLTTMTRTQATLNVMASEHEFERFGKSGQVMNKLFRHTGTIADEMCIIRSLNTEPINHDPAVTFLQTGSPLAGRPSMGSWLSYGQRQFQPTRLCRPAFGQRWPASAVALLEQWISAEQTPGCKISIRR